MFPDTISDDEKKELELSEPVYSIGSVTNTFKQYLHRYFDKNSERFEQVWTSNDDVPQKSQYFYEQFPKKASNFDNEHHHSNFNMYGYCSRWLPRPVVLILFPFHSLIYDEHGNRLSDTQPEMGIKRQLRARGVPTNIECQLCDEAKGFGVWDRKGNWFCIRDGASLDVSVDDEMGPKIFTNFNQYRLWRKQLSDKIESASLNGDELEVTKLESLKTKSNIPHDCIVEN